MNRWATIRATARGALRTRHTTARWLLAAVLVGSPLALGGIPAEVLASVAMILTLVTLARSRRPNVAIPHGARLVIWTGMGLIAYTYAQSIPLPFEVLARIAPHNADVWARALAPFGEPGPRWAPISIDPIAARVEALKGIVYVSRSSPP